MIKMASMSEYTELQIIKHVLMYYIGRPNASENDLLMETHLLNKTVERIEVLKDHYEIKKKRVQKIAFKVIKDIYWEDWGHLRKVFCKGDVCKGEPYPSGAVSAESPYYQDVFDTVDLDSINIL